MSQLIKDLLNKRKMHAERIEESAKEIDFLRREVKRYEATVDEEATIVLDIDRVVAFMTSQDAPDTEDAEESDHYFLRPNKPIAPDPAQRSVEIDGEWIDGDDEEGNKRSVEYSQGFEAGRLGYGYVAGNSEDWLTGYADGQARRDEVDASEGYAPVTSPAADEAAAGHDYYSPENVAKRTRSVFDIFRPEPEEVG